MTTIAGGDDARNEAADFLGAWRLAIPDLLFDNPVVAGQFATFVEASVSHPLILVAHIEERLRTVQWTGSATIAEPLLSTELFPGETAFPATRLRLIRDASVTDARVVRLADWVAANLNIKKVLLFVSDSEIADRFAEQLEDCVKTAIVIRYRGSASELQAFESTAQQVLLVCDRRAEEGLNLQRVGAVIIHGDLPLEPTRVEQRIGRVDRIEARGHLRNVVFAADHDMKGSGKSVSCTECGSSTDQWHRYNMPSPRPSLESRRIYCEMV